MAEPSIFPQHMNPDPTPELDREVAFFLKWGYLVVEEDERFSFLLDNPPVITRMKAILGNCLQLHSATARITLPGAVDQGWHRDGPWPRDPGRSTVAISSMN